MNKKERDKFKKVLAEERRRIQRHLDELSEDSEAQLGNTSGDQADLASTEISQTSLQKIGKRESYLLRKIDYALEKIEDGTYGQCELCGEEISAKRLLARPVAQLCIHCKTDQENSEKKFQNWDGDEEGEFDYDEEVSEG